MILARNRQHYTTWEPVPYRQGSKQKLSFFMRSLPAGFPWPVEDSAETRLDLEELLIEHPTATFFVRVEGDSMTGAGILPNDILVVDRAIPPKEGAVVVAILDGEFTVKRLKREKNHLYLVAENPSYPPLAITPEHDFEVWGVVVYAIHSIK